jgi:serine protease Do
MELPQGQGIYFNTNRPRLGLSIQDTEDGKGVKVIDVDDEGNAAKAGVKEGDIVTRVDDKVVNSADEITKMIRENKERTSVKLQVIRNGKTQNIDVKLPRKLKTSSL